MEKSLLTKEKSTILKYFPSYRPVWDRIVGRVPVKVMEDELYTYYAYICLRDFADRYQIAGTAFFKALEEFALQRRLMLNANPRIASIFSFRYHFDYAIIALFSSINHLISSLFYFYEKVNKIEDNTRTIKQILEPKKVNLYPIELKCLAEKYYKDYRYLILENYRNNWTHKGIPKIEGEYRPKRINPIENHGFSNNVLGLVQHKGGFAMVAWSDEADYSVHGLVACASWLYKKVGVDAIAHFEEVEKTLNFTLELNDLFGRGEEND